MDDLDGFYVSTYRQVYRVIIPMTLDVQDTEDVLQESYAAAARHWAAVRALDSPLAWVRRVAVNKALDLRRRRVSHKRAYGLLQPSVQHREDVSLEVLDALSRLPAAERQVVVLHHLLGLGVEELAEEVGRPSGTVRALVRGRRHLAQALRLEEGMQP